MTGKLMNKLSTLKQAGRLRLLTSLRPVKRNATRWTGVPDMFDRLQRLLPTLQNANDEIVHLVPSPSQIRKIQDHKQALEDFKSITKTLQGAMSIKDSHAVFESITESYPMFDFASYLSLGASIIHDKALESALVKIQSNNEDTLSVSEQRSVEKLLLPMSHQQEEDIEDGKMSFAERALKSQRKVENKSNTRYIDTQFVLPTSNIAERLFSMAKRVFNPHRRSLHPRTLEALLFLNQSRSLWSLPLVTMVVNKTPSKTDDGDEDEDSIEEC
jgi:hypothetical protein